MNGFINNLLFFLKNNLMTMPSSQQLCLGIMVLGSDIIANSCYYLIEVECVCILSCLCSRDWPSELHITNLLKYIFSFFFSLLTDV